MVIAAEFVDIPRVLESKKNQLHHMLASVDAQFGGVEFYPTLFHKAAMYAHRIIKGHIFHDGNKRTGFACAFEFLELNALPKPADIDDREIIALGEGIVDGSINVEAIAERLRAWFS